MVNYFFFGEETVNMLLHYKSVLKDVSFRRCSWMIGCIYKNVASCLFYLATFPVGMKTSSFERSIGNKMSTFIPSSLPFFKLCFRTSMFSFSSYFRLMFFCKRTPLIPRSNTFLRATYLFFISCSKCLRTFGTFFYHKRQYTTAGCTEVTALNGSLTAQVVACP